MSIMSAILQFAVKVVVMIQYSYTTHTLSWPVRWCTSSQVEVICHKFTTSHRHAPWMQNHCRVSKECLVTGEKIAKFCCFYTTHLLSAVWYPIESPIIVTIWNVVFANKSGKLGWIWMKLGRCGWGLKRLSLARFQLNRAMGFGESKKMGRIGVVFLWHEPRTTSSTFLYRFPPNFPWTHVQVLSCDTWFHIPERFPFRGRISQKKHIFMVF